MKWANFLHIYQPSDQQPDVLEAVVVQSYRPLIQGMLENEDIRLTMNITGTLLELFDRYGYKDLIDGLRELGSSQRVEFTGSAKYHAFLPLIPTDEIYRQIQINNETCKFYLGDAYHPKGFFPPEMGYSNIIKDIVSDMNFSWIILDEIAFNGNVDAINPNKLYKLDKSPLFCFFRQRRISNLIMSANVRHVSSLLESLRTEVLNDVRVITAMDGETFGHHRPGLEKTLFDFFRCKEFDFVCISDFLSNVSSSADVEVFDAIDSTWASSKSDIEKGIQFLSWNDPTNPIHTWQWDFLEFALSEVKSLGVNHSSYKKVRDKMDAALASDCMWWASGKPWWSLEMIEVGAYRFLDIIRALPSVTPEKLERASKYYENIVTTAFNWQRTGKIRQMAKEQQELLRIPFKDRTLAAGGSEQGVYFAFIDMLKTQEKKAALTGEYEKAILWRDAIYKLENKLDIYDVINAIDLLRVDLGNDIVEKTINQYKAKYNEIRGGQPEQRE